MIVAAGEGTRYGGRKQFATLAGRCIVAHAVGALVDHVDGAVVVVPPDVLEGRGGRFGPLVEELGLAPLATRCELRLVAGGASRAASVRSGLAELPGSCEVVVVHDAARPLASPALCEAVVEAVRAGAAGAVPALPVHDTVKRVRGREVVETVDRTELVRVQTPQAFSTELLRRAHAGEPEATDDAGLVEAIGGQVVVVPGEEWNVKVTDPADLGLVSFWHERLSRDRSPGSVRSR